MTKLSSYINQFITIDQSEKEIIESAFKEISLPKGTKWITEGKVCDQVGYIVSGKLRVYYIDESGNDITCYFINSDNFISSFTSFLTNTPTKENISAIEDTELRIISKNDLEKLSVTIPKIQIFRRVIAENLFIIMEKRINMLQSQSAQERYEKMLKENPDIILSIPLQYIASFLGITPQHLSRLRKKLSK
jgi:CRP-like cAMP-binding protein